MKKLIAIALLLMACPAPVPELLVIPFCNLPQAACVPCADDICDGLAGQVWCCDKVGDGGCIPAELLTDCDALSQYAVWCEHGQSVPITNADGTAGFECFG